MPSIQPDRLADQVYVALRAAFSDLINVNAHQRFYAFALFTDDSLQFLHPAANTEEALTSTLKRYREKVDPKYGCTSTRAGLRWSYGDWGFFVPDAGEKHFKEINGTLRTHFDRMGAEEDSEEEFESLWSAILNGFQRLEQEGFFGSGAERSKITLLLVGDLPPELVESWVSALNPPDVANRFINWNCNAPDDSE
ncbi:conserved hypothetical protein [Chthoniobacter flavus Ellin428]|uniref:DUF4303 domain-containing protein n=1 Tax=Chthoniobacter flavus Ellin428 TaxID=497964 RepID=B4CUR7_9BACT|nr:DUF4303 domain-containing protein [Chthoniobacter flavus]EDY22305.1 conserved hypothetical protein [Chthoniobacter flavus Ellin428]TCO94679.1 uncharacterized protein DUF4303 [Chthoniobacter flavus]